MTTDYYIGYALTAVLPALTGVGIVYLITRFILFGGPWGMRLTPLSMFFGAILALIVGLVATCLSFLVYLFVGSGIERGMGRILPMAPVSAWLGGLLVAGLSSVPVFIIAAIQGQAADSTRATDAQP